MWCNQCAEGRKYRKAPVTGVRVIVRKTSRSLKVGHVHTAVGQSQPGGGGPGVDWQVQAEVWRARREVLGFQGSPCAHSQRAVDRHSHRRGCGEDASSHSPALEACIQRSSWHTSALLVENVPEQSPGRRPMQAADTAWLLALCHCECTHCLRMHYLSS